MTAARRESVIPAPIAEAAAAPLRAAEVDSRTRALLGGAIVPTLLRLQGDPAVEIHPEDAGRREIRDGDWVEVGNDRGAFLARARVGETVRPGTVFTPTVWWSRLAFRASAQEST